MPWGVGVIERADRGVTMLRWSHGDDLIPCVVVWASGDAMLHVCVCAGAAQQGRRQWGVWGAWGGRRGEGDLDAALCHANVRPRRPTPGAGSNTEGSMPWMPCDGEVRGEWSVGRAAQDTCGARCHKGGMAVVPATRVVLPQCLRARAHTQTGDVCVFGFCGAVWGSLF